jgi:hypothetical protein
MKGYIPATLFFFVSGKLIHVIIPYGKSRSHSEMSYKETAVDPQCCQAQFLVAPAMTLYLE